MEKITFFILAVAALVSAQEGGFRGVQGGHEEHYVDYHGHPKYEFKYAVHDPKTKDNKAQEESRDGDIVKGYYTLVQPDHKIRKVHYEADKHGFRAQVHYEGHGSTGNEGGLGRSIGGGQLNGLGGSSSISLGQSRLGSSGFGNGRGGQLNGLGASSSISLGQSRIVSSGFGRGGQLNGFGASSSYSFGQSGLGGSGLGGSRGLGGIGGSFGGNIGFSGLGGLNGGLNGGSGSGFGFNLGGLNGGLGGGLRGGLGSGLGGGLRGGYENNGRGY